MADTKTTSVISGNYRPMTKEPAVLVFVSPEDRENYPEMDYGELHEATCRWFVDKCGFSTRSFVCTDACKETGIPGPVAKVTFVDDGIVMAKIQGLIP